jgi:pimeloyl-ACP methyl ester carboxylesterase
VQTLALIRPLAPFGTVRIFGLAEAFAQGSAVGDSLTPEGHQMFLAIYNRTDFSQAVKYEYETEMLNVTQTRPLYELGDVPLVVLAKAGDDVTGSLPGITEEALIQANEITMDLQEELAALSTDGELIVVENTGHYIQIDQPDVVIDAVNTMVSSLQ